MRISGTQFAIDVLECFILIPCRIFLQGLDDGIVILGIHHFHCLVAQCEEFANDRCGQGFKRASDRDFSVTDIGNEDFGGDFFFVEFFAEFESFWRVEEIDDFLVGGVAHSAEERGR